jgi:hypothetical protein
MGKVLAGITISVDGFITPSAADPDARQRPTRCSGGVRHCCERTPGSSSKAAKSAGDCVASASHIN